MPRSYDEITRSTVPNPDSSFRPSKEQEQQAREGFRMLDEDEHALHDKVMKAVAGSGIDIEVTRTNVALRGQVSNSAELTRLEDVVRAVDGVGSVKNDLVVGS